MTTIAWDLNKRAVAVDSRITTDDGDLITDSAEKRFERRGVVFFLAGSVADVEEVTNAFCAGAHRVRKSIDFEGIAWTGEKLFELLAERGSLDWHPVVSPQGACGSGASFAMAALKDGSTPYKAVRAAARCNVNTGGKIRVHRLRRKA